MTENDLKQLQQDDTPTERLPDADSLVWRQAAIIKAHEQRIAELEAENRRLRDVLTPFANCAEWFRATRTTNWRGRSLSSYSGTDLTYKVNPADALMGINFEQAEHALKAIKS